MVSFLVCDIYLNKNKIIWRMSGRRQEWRWEDNGHAAALVQVRNDSDSRDDGISGAGPRGKCPYTLGRGPGF